MESADGANGGCHARVLIDTPDVCEVAVLRVMPLGELIGAVADPLRESKCASWTKHAIAARSTGLHDRVRPGGHKLFHRVGRRCDDEVLRQCGSGEAALREQP